MKKTLYILIFLIFSQYGSAQNEEKDNNKNVLFGCLTKKDIDIINEGITIFKEQLKNHYLVETKLDISVYEKYLNDFSRMRLPRDFFSSKEAINYLKQIKRTSTFNVLYKLYEEPKYEEPEPGGIEIPITKRIEVDEKEKEELPDFYVLDGKEKFVTCLIQKSKDKDLKDYFQTLEEISDLSPTIKASVLAELINQHEEDVDVITLSITFDLFYGSILMFNKF